MKKIIKIESTDGETRYLNPSYVKEVKTSRSEYGHGTCVTLVLQDNNIITRLYEDESDADAFVEYVLDCIKKTHRYENHKDT